MTIVTAVTRHHPRARASVVAALVAGLLAVTPGCYGNFSLTRKIYSWNGEVTNNKVANSLVMWGLLIIQVYSVGGLVDLIILNPIEFFTGQNPVVAHADGSLTTTVQGQRLVFRQTPQGQIEVEQNGVVTLRYQRVGDRVQVEDARGRALAEIDARAQALASGPTRVSVY